MCDFRSIDQWQARKAQWQDRRNFVDEVVLDTGCACTIVHRDFMPGEKMVPGSTVQLRCAHGDTFTYPLAAVTLEIDGLTLPVTAAVAERLPVSALLGTDVPELRKLINQHALPQAEALVMTRAQANAQTQAKVQAQQKQHQSQVAPNPIEDLQPLPTLDPLDSTNVDTIRKREARHYHGLVRTKDRPKRKWLKKWGSTGCDYSICRRWMRH